MKTKLKPIGNIILIIGNKDVATSIATKITMHDHSLVFIKYEDCINDKLTETWNKFVTKVHYYLTHIDVVLISDDRYNESKLWEEVGKKPKYVIRITEE